MRIKFSWHESNRVFGYRVECYRTGHFYADLKIGKLLCSVTR